MSGTAKGITSRSEDVAYCLLGLFSVNMPLMYGEGAKQAFLRLINEIMRLSDDHSIFAWTIPVVDDVMHGLLADSPSAFSEWRPATSFQIAFLMVPESKEVSATLVFWSSAFSTAIAIMLGCSPSHDISYSATEWQNKLSRRNLMF